MNIAETRTHELRILDVPYPPTEDNPESPVLRLVLDYDGDGNAEWVHLAIGYGEQTRWREDKNLSESVLAHPNLFSLPADLRTAVGSALLELEAKGKRITKPLPAEES